MFNKSLKYFGKFICFLVYFLILIPEILMDYRYDQNKTYEKHIELLNNNRNRLEKSINNNESYHRINTTIKNYENYDLLKNINCLKFYLRNYNLKKNKSKKFSKSSKHHFRRSRFHYQFDKSLLTYRRRYQKLFRRYLCEQFKSHKVNDTRQEKQKSLRKFHRHRFLPNRFKHNLTRKGSSIGNHNRLNRLLTDIDRRRRAVTAKKELIWDYGVIPYEIDKIFKPQHKALFKRAMRHWENVTCLKFVERDVNDHPNYIYFTIKNCGCCSFVGKSGKGRQDLSIGRNCEKFGIVLHELGHAIGFWHEHTRADRDKHIIINRANIMKGQEHNFEVQSPEVVDSLDLPYDYNSIMHYARDTFSKSSYLDTIQPIGKMIDAKIEIGQRIHLSKGDIAQANLLYKCVPCGRTFQKGSGYIAAPHYETMKTKEIDIQSQYDKIFEVCEWRITATQGERIALQIHNVNLLTSDNCSKDYLEIRDGYWHKSPLLSRLCGNETSISFESQSSRILLTYVNRHAAYGYRGFDANFDIICGRDIMLVEKERIDSPNYPLEYYADRECIWHVTVPENHKIALKFEFFDLENHEKCIYDRLEVRDGNSSDSKLIAFLCGYKIPSIIKSKTNQMYVKFVSDGSVQKMGFSAIFIEEIDHCKYTEHGCEHECINTLTSFRCICLAGYELQTDGKSCADTCGGIIDTSLGNGTFTSPSFPDVYPISKQCIWEIIAPDNHAIFLNFTHFDLEGAKFQYTECSYDYLVVYSKLRDNKLRKIGVFCGNEIPPIVNSEQNILRLEFYSDKAVQHTGFVAHYQVDINECSENNGGCQHHCRNTYGSYYCTCRIGYTLNTNQHNCTETLCKFEITKAFGIISSPRFPDHYPRNMYCYWRFHTILGHRLQLTFREFDLEDHQECIYDYLAIHDGKSENNSLLGIYCGNQLPYGILASTNNMFLVLKTDASLQHKGFKAIFSTECGGYLKAINRTQIFYSHPRYGSRFYRRNMYCNWRIQADSESSVQISFLQFELEYSENCDYDFVEITEEPNLYRNTNYGKYCGNQKPPVIVSYSDTLLLRFQTDNVTTMKGFAVSFISVEPPDDDLSDDYLFVTPFPGYMKSIYYASDKRPELSNSSN